MSAYYLNLVAINPKREEIRSDPVRVLVDTGSELSWMPAEVLVGAGIQPRRKRQFRMADGRAMERDVGFCILESEGFVTNDEVVFAQPGDMHLLGVRTIQGFGVTVDSLAHKLVATSTLAAAATPPSGWPGVSTRIPTLLAKRGAARRRRRLELYEETRHRLRSALAELIPGHQVLVFGSLTKPGLFNDRSDVDLALESEPAHLSQYQLISQLTERLHRPVDVVLLAQCRFRAKIRREGEPWTA